MTSIRKFYSPVSYAALACAVMSVTSAAQTPSDSTSPDPLLGVPLGGSRSVVTTFLTSRGWTRTVDSVPEAVGKPSIFSGTIDGHPAEIVAMFGMTRDRMLHLVVNFPAGSTKELESVYVWAYRRMEKLRCRASLPADYRIQLDSMLAGKPIGLPDRSHVYASRPVSAGHSTVDSDPNTDWPHPSWLTADGGLGTRLTASMLDTASRWPYEVTLWSSVMFAVSDDVTICPDTRAAAKARDPHVARSAAPGETTPIDTLTVITGSGVRGTVGTHEVHTRRLGDDDTLSFTVVAPRGKRIAYAVAADTGFDNLMVVLDMDSVGARGTVALEGNQTLMMAAERMIGADSPNKRLYDLFRVQLTATDHRSAYVDIECEMERLTKAFPDSAQRLIDAAQQKAIDPVRDAKALIRIDDALGGHVYGGCVEDRRMYQKKP
jgi:hypothetical protein